MGRKKLNRTKEELDELNRIRLRRYYKNHKQEILDKRMERYNSTKSKRNIQDSEQN
jgi:hypothetical protein